MLRLSGTLANRPSAGSALGARYLATDNQTIYFSVGGVWIANWKLDQSDINRLLNGPLAQRPLSNTCVGSVFIDDATGNRYEAFPDGWVPTVLSGGGGGPPPATGLLVGLAAYWKLDEAAGTTRLDSHGTINLDDVSGVGQAAGILNNSASWVSTSNPMLHSANSALVCGNIDFTISMWVYLTNNSHFAYILQRADYSNCDYMIFYDNSISRFGFSVGAYSVSINSASAPSIGAWHHIVAWHDSVAHTINIKLDNGTTASQSSVGNEPVNVAHDFYIGDLEPGYGDPWDGRVDETGLWKRVLTAAEITGLFNGGAALPYSSFASFTPPAATGISMVGPSGGAAGTPSAPFTVALAPGGGTVSGTVTVTPNDGGGGGTFTPSTVGLTTAAPSATFTYTPASSGAKTISATNNGGLSNPSSLTYTVSAAGVHLLNSIVSYWPLDGTIGPVSSVPDVAGGNSLVGFGPPTGVVGKINDAIDFTGGQNLGCATNPSLEVGGNVSYVLSCWVKFNAFPATGSFMGIISKFGDGANQFEYLVDVNNDSTAGLQLRFGAWHDNSTEAKAFVNMALTTGTWYHIVAWYDSSTGHTHIRVNDSIQGDSSTAIAGTESGTGVQFNLGSTQYASGGYFFLNGIMDEVGFWKNRILVPAEVTALYNGGAGLPYSSFTS